MKREDKDELQRGLSVEQASRRGGWSRATTYRLIAAGKLKSVRVLGRRIIKPEIGGRALGGWRAVIASKNPGPGGEPGNAFDGAPYPSRTR